MQIREMRDLIKKRRIAPSLIGTSQDVQTCFNATLGCKYVAWAPLKKKTTAANMTLKSLSVPSTSVLTMIREVLNEGGEEGMYGQATVLLAEMIDCMMTRFQQTFL